MINTLNSFVKFGTIQSIQIQQNKNSNNRFNEVPMLSYKALANQVKAMAEADNNSKLGAKLNIVV